MPSVQIAVCYCAHDDHYFLAQSMHSFAASGKLFAFVSRQPWSGRPGDWERTSSVAGAAGAEVVLGEWNSETDHRQCALQILRERGITHAFIPDGDEIVEPALLQSLLGAISVQLAERIYVHMDTYWKSPEFVIRPRETLTPAILIDLRASQHVHIRQYEGGRSLLLPPDHGVLHHLSYCGPDARIRRKVETWSHRDEVVRDWWQKVWVRWDADKLLRDLHPTHPSAYGMAERIAIPPILEDSLERHRELVPSYTTSRPLVKPVNWPTVSIVIPLHGGVDDIQDCLRSLEKCLDLFAEVVVVDNASPDGAANTAAEFAFVRLLRNDHNAGYAAACNRGIEETSGDIVVLLNSDTIITRAGFIRLIEALARSGSIAAAGPYTNKIGHLQQVAPTYTSLENLDLFGEDFALRPYDDVEVDMLVGFCLAIRRSVLNEIGYLDEGFGLGMFEDNDLCYRIRRAGFRLVIASRSFIHHHGSRTLRRMKIDVPNLLSRNLQYYRRKWRDDLESAFASHLAGISQERIIFNQMCHPDSRLRNISDLVRRADISLCMIVRDEERVLGEALASAKPFFNQVVVVDTGSKDNTVEIAKAAGAEVFKFTWTDSFSDARNESLRNARGRWIFWMDADDTLPWQSGEAIVHAVLEANDEIVGFVVPVQFVGDAGLGGGTRVDHVKLFRNLAGVSFEGRIHEQILPSLRSHGGTVARCRALVLHSGYDTSTEGQAKKRIRDSKLLKLDLKERPNHPFVLFNLGMTDHFNGEHASAVRWLRKSIKASGPAESHVRKAYVLLAVSLRVLGKPDECMKVINEGLDKAAGDPELHFQAGQTLAEQERLEEAKFHFLQVVGTDISGHFSSVDVGILGYRTYHSLGTVCWQMDAYRDAQEYWSKAIGAEPPFLPSAFALFDAALSMCDYFECQRLMEIIRRTEGESKSWATMGARYAEAVGGPSNVEHFLRGAIAKSDAGLGPYLILARHLAQSGRHKEAVPYLRMLDDEGIPDAAFYLGVMEEEGGDLSNALIWFERANALNPGHAATSERIHAVTQRLSETARLQNGDASRMSPSAFSNAVPFDNACLQIATDMGLNADELLRFAAEDNVGGYGTSEGMPESGWPGGSVWEVEGKLLYALVRATKPLNIVEIGSLVGCSTSHLAAACKKNGRGTVFAVDPQADFARVSPALMRFIRPIKQDVLAWRVPNKIDFVFEDGSHEPGFTRAVLEKLKPHLAPGAIVCSHDAMNKRLGAVVTEEFIAVMGPASRTVLPAPSDCGIGYVRV